MELFWHQLKKTFLAVFGFIIQLIFRRKLPEWSEKHWNLFPKTLLCYFAGVILIQQRRKENRNQIFCSNHDWVPSHCDWNFLVIYFCAGGQLSVKKQKQKKTTCRDDNDVLSIEKVRQVCREKNTTHFIIFNRFQISVTWSGISRSMKKVPNRSHSKMVVVRSLWQVLKLWSSLLLIFKKKNINNCERFRC